MCTDAHRLGGYGILPYPRCQQHPQTSVNSVNSVGDYIPTEPTERTEPSGREVPPTDWHGCAQIRRVWHPAIPTLPLESSCLSSALPTVRARTAPTKQAGISPTERTEHTEPSGREVPPTDWHGCAQIRRVWHPAIPTLPLESSCLSSALPTVRARTAPTKQAGISPTERTEHTEPSGREVPPTDWHGCAQIRRVWHPAIPTQPQESSCLSSAFPPVRARTAPTKQARISPTERTEHTEHSGREAPPTEHSLSL